MNASPGASAQGEVFSVCGSVYVAEGFAAARLINPREGTGLGGRVQIEIALGGSDVEKTTS